MSRLLFEAAFFFFACDEVADGHAWFDKNHTWTAVTHDGADLFTHVRTIAMHMAIGTEGLIFHKGAVVAALVGVAFEGDTFGAEPFFGVMHAFAVESNHLTDDDFFFGAFLFNIGHGDSPWVRCLQYRGRLQRMQGPDTMGKEL